MLYFDVLGPLLRKEGTILAKNRRKSKKNKVKILDTNNYFTNVVGGVGTDRMCLRDRARA